MGYRLQKLWGLVILMVTVQVTMAGTIVAPTGLMTNLLTKPENSVITTPVPVFSWIVPTQVTNDIQTAYQVVVASSSEFLENGQADLWDSGKVEAGNNLHIAYAGSPLSSASTYYWKVRVWNKDGKVSAYSEVQQFHIGDTVREKQWPSESRWVQLDTGSGGEKMWTFEDRPPIQYHPAYTLRLDRPTDRSEEPN